MTLLDQDILVELILQIKNNITGKESFLGDSFLLPKIKGGGKIRKLKDYKPTKFMAKDSVYNKDAADYAVSFIQALTHTKGRWAGKHFELIDWQEQIIRTILNKIIKSDIIS